MDAEYLQRTVGESLAIALAEVSSVRPADPIEFLAAWLLKRTANQREKEGGVTVSSSEHGVCIAIGASKTGSMY